MIKEQAVLKIQNTEIPVVSLHDPFVWVFLFCAATLFIIIVTIAKNKPK